MVKTSRRFLSRFLSSGCGTLVLMCVSVGASQEVDLLEFLAAGREHNKSSIRSATGKAVVTFTRVVNTDDALVLDKAGKGGMERREIRWYVSGEKRRVDEKSIDIPEGQARFTLPRTRETAWSPEERIYLHHFQKHPPEAYINNSWGEDFKFVRNVTNYFDPMLFFDVGEYSSLEKVYEKFGSSFRVSTEKTGTGNCYKLYGETTVRDNLRLRIELEIDPSQGYSVTKMREYSSLYAEGPVAVLDVTYTDGGTNGESYFPETYHYRMEGGSITETVDVKFSEVVINKPVDPVAFTFEGMGVPPGTKLIDMRYGEHIHSYYKGLPAEELNKLAADIHKEEWAKPLNSDSNAPVASKALEETGPNTLDRSEGDDPSTDRRETTIGKGGVPSGSLLTAAFVAVVVVTLFVIHRKMTIGKQ